VGWGVVGWVGLVAEREREREEKRGGGSVEVDALYSYSTPGLLQLFVSQFFKSFYFIICFCLCFFIAFVVILVFLMLLRSAISLILFFNDYFVTPLDAELVIAL
jgi:hypothetical protein